MSALDAIELWAAELTDRTDLARANIRKLVVVARAVRRWREARCLVDVPHSGAACNRENHEGDCPVFHAMSDLADADIALEIP